MCRMKRKIPGDIFLTKMLDWEEDWGISSGSSNLQSCLGGGGGSPPTSSSGGQVTTDAPARTSKSNPSHPGGRWSKAFPISDAANPLTHAIADNGFLQRHQWWEIGDTWLKRFWDNMTLTKDLKSRTLHCCFAGWWSKSQKNVWLRGVGGNWSTAHR